MRIKHNLRGGGHLFVTKSWGRLVAASGTTLVVLSILALSPSPIESVSAEASTIKTNVTVQPVLGLTMGSNNYVVDVTPTETGSFSSHTATVSVTTNNETGYSIYLATQNGQSTLTNAEGTAEIAPVSGTVTSTNFTANTWGYNLSKEAVTDATTYQAVPTQNDDPAGGSETPVDGDSYNLTFGAFINTDLPGGAYTNQVVVSAVVNPAYVPTLSAIDNMQDMTPAICQASSENETKQLTDTRNGKKYWVAKLADNNCWMTQNLDLDLSTSKPLTPDDSDVSSNWTPTASTTTSIFSNTSSTGQYSWDPGMYVKSDPDGYSNYCFDVDSLSDSDCTSAGWTDVSSMTPMSDGTTNTAISGNTYNAHYLVGNYYQWNAATAGTGGTITSTNATDSICPKGWQLPTSNNSNSGSFQALMNAYSISSNTTGSTKITQSPLYFHPSGGVNSGSLRYVGNYGYYWSSTAYSNSSLAYSLTFDSGYVGPSGIINRYYGQSVRCLARQ